MCLDESGYEELMTTAKARFIYLLRGILRIEMKSPLTQE